jgi:hypothetical protein
VVKPGHSADRISDQVLVEDIGDLVHGQCAGVAFCGHGVHLQLDAHAEELDQGLVRHPIGMHPVKRGHGVGEGTDHA